MDATAFQGVNSNCVVTVQRGMTGWGEVPGTWQGMPTRYADEEQPPANADAQFFRVGFDD